jgi:4-amino-4-deoxy-L-arabinose transferase-like glycosyltransferase
MFARLRQWFQRRSPPATDDTRPSRRERALEKFVVEEIELKDVSVPRPKERRARPDWWRAARRVAGWTGLLALPVAATLFARRAWPLDETRLLAIAWEMWSRGSLAVPVLNGEAIAQPPLMPWLTQLGWRAFGVNELWARVLPALFAFGSLVLVGRLARRLWPEQIEIARYAPYTLIGTLYFAFSAPLLTTDMAALFSVLLALWVLAVMWRTRDARLWPLLGLALVFGLFAHGPLVLAYILPAAVLAPLWARGAVHPMWRHWQQDVAKATLVAVLLLLAWLVPASWQAGGWWFVRDYLWHAPRYTALEFYPVHGEWWWYLWLAPVLMLPWAVLPLAWMRLWQARRHAINPGLALCLLWGVSGLALLSLLPGKQPQWLLPLLPSASLFLAWLLFEPTLEGRGERHALAGMSLPLMAVGALLAVLPKLPRVDFLPELLWSVSPWVGIGLVGLGVALAWLPLAEARQRVVSMAMASVALTVFVILGAGSRFDSLYAADEPARRLGALEGERRPLAHVGEYHGQFQFAGRLTTPLAVIESAQAAAWAQQNTDGVLVTYAAWQPRVVPGAAALWEANYRDRSIRLWESRALLAPREAGEPDVPVR